MEAVAAVPALLEMLVGARPGVPEGAAAILQRVPRWSTTAEAKASVPALIAAQSHAQQNVRRLAGAALQEVDADWPVTDAAKAAVPSFARMLESPSAEVRIEAVELLGRIAETRAFAGLVQGLRDPDARVRAQAGAYLRKTRDERAVGVLVAELLDSESKAREAVAAILSEIGNERAAMPLMAIALDARSDIRAASARALRTFAAPRDEARSRLLPIVEAALDLARTPPDSPVAASWRGFLGLVAAALRYSEIVVGISSSSEADGYHHREESTHGAWGFCLCGQPEGGADERRRDDSRGITTHTLTAVGPPAVWLLAQGQLLEVETTFFSSHAAMSSSSHHWSSGQRVLEIETFLEARYDRAEALRRCCRDTIDVLDQLCGPEDETFAGIRRAMTDAGLIRG